MGNFHLIDLDVDAELNAVRVAEADGDPRARRVGRSRISSIRRRAAKFGRAGDLRASYEAGQPGKLSSGR